MRGAKHRVEHSSRQLTAPARPRAEQADGEAHSCNRAEAFGVPRSPHPLAGALPTFRLPRRVPPTNMRLLAAALLLLLLALCATRVDGECLRSPSPLSHPILGIPSANCKAAQDPPGSRWAPRATQEQETSAQLNSRLRTFFHRVQVQVLTEGAQDPLQRREETGDEAQVPALRGEDGYVSSVLLRELLASNPGKGHSGGWVHLANSFLCLCQDLGVLCNCPVSS